LFQNAIGCFVFEQKKFERIKAIKVKHFFGDEFWPLSKLNDQTVKLNKSIFV
jgi:hypothetical protein